MNNKSKLKRVSEHLPAAGLGLVCDVGELSVHAWFPRLNEYERVM